MTSALFFSGQVRLLLKRCRKLRAHLHSLKTLPPELRPHIDEIDKKLSDLDAGLERLLADPDFAAPALLLNQFDDFKRYAEIVNVFEWHPMALLDHYNERDHHFYQFMKLLCAQVRYGPALPIRSRSTLVPTQVAAIFRASFRCTGARSKWRMTISSMHNQ